MSCLRCGEDFGGKLWKTSYAIPYNKCRGKTCPDCGKVRRLGGYESIYTENPRYFNPCVKCKRTTNYWIDKICSKCFLERERKRGCVCFFDNDYDESKGHHNNINYYCPLCDEVHPREALCKKCFEKQTGSYQRKLENIIKELGIDPSNDHKLKEQIRKWKPQVSPLKVFLPTAIISLVIGFFLGWLFFKKLRKGKKRKMQVPNQTHY